MEFNAIAEVDLKATPANIDRTTGPWMDALTQWGVTLGASEAGRIEVIITVQARDLGQAAATIVPIIETATGRKITWLQVMPTPEFDAWGERLPPIPELVGPAEAAQMLGVSRQRVLDLVDRGRLQHRRVGARGIAISAASARLAAHTERRTGRPKKKK